MTTCKRNEDSSKPMIRLTPHNGIPRHILLTMAVMAGFTVPNLYYNQPLLEMICRETGITQVEANLITVEQ